MTIALRKIETADRKRTPLRDDQWRTLCLFILMAVEIVEAEEDNDLPFTPLELAIVQDLLDNWKGPLSDVQEWMLLRMKDQILDTLSDPDDPRDQHMMLLRRFLGELH